MRKELTEFLKKYTSLGWTFKHASKHLKLISPKGSLVVISKSPSCPHYLKHVEGDIRKINRLESA